MRDCSFERTMVYNMPQTLSDIKTLLSERGLHPRHRFGQNFLHDHNKLKNIIDAASIQVGDCVLEVGPGTGALTECLLEAGAAVIAVEIDRDLCALIRDRFANQIKAGRLQLIESDALAGKHELAPQITEVLGGRDTPFKLVANLPYNAASPLIINLTRDYPSMKLGIVLIQKEVAQRLSASHGGKDYGPLGILVQTQFNVDMVTVLPPGCFWPPPKVTSAVARLRRRKTALITDVPGFATLVQKLFQQRRKQIGSLLGRDFPFPEGIQPTMRPEALSLEQLIELYEIKR